jgi:hypothetical protein
MPKPNRKATRSTIQNWIPRTQLTMDDFPIYEATDDPQRDQCAAKTTHCLTNGLSRTIGDVLYWLTDERRLPNRRPVRAAAFQPWGNPDIQLVRRVRPECEKHLEAALTDMKQATAAHSETRARILCRSATHRMAQTLELLTDGRYQGAAGIAALPVD